MVTVSTTRKKKKAATRMQLRDAALRCFADKGYLATAIGDISREAGVAHGTFYVHFPDKEALADELLAEFNAELAIKIANAWARFARPSSNFRRMIERTAELFLDSWHERRVFVEAYAYRAATGVTLMNLREGINPPMHDLLTKAMRTLEGGVSLPIADLAAEALLAAWMRIGLNYLFGQGVTKERAVRALVAVSLGTVIQLTPGRTRRLPRQSARRRRNA